MEVSEQKLFSALCGTFCAAVEKARAESMSLTDMYVLVKYDDQQVVVYDDADGVLAQATIEEFDEWREAHEGEATEAVLVALLR